MTQPSHEWALDCSGTTCKSHRWIQRLAAGLVALAVVAGGGLGSAAWAGGTPQQGQPVSTSTGCETCGSGGDSGDKTGTDGAQTSHEKPTGQMGDPVIISTGEFVKQQFDVRGEIGGEMFSVQRRYGNQKTVNRGFGQKWDSNLFARVVDTDVEARVYTYDQNPVIFDDTGSGFAGPAGYTLTQDASGYTYTTLNGLTYQFDTTGTIESLTLRTGQQCVWVYDGTGKLTAVEDAAGSDLYHFYYDTNDLITQAEHVPGNRSIYYEYDTGAGELTRVTGACASCGATPERRYEYDANHNLVTMRNADAEVVLVNLYDSENRVTRQQRGTTAASFDYSGFASGKYTYVDFASVTQDYYEDARHNVTRITHSGTVGGAPVSYTQSYQYDGDDNLTRTVTPEGRIIQTPRDANGRRSAYIVGEGVNAITRESYEYGSFGNVTREVTADGTVTTYAYNTEGMMTQQAVDPTGLNLVSTMAYNGNGQITRYTDAEGHITDSLYDGSGYLTKRIVDPGGLAIATSYFVDPIGRVTKRVDPRGSAWVRYYNTAGLVTKTVDPSGQTVLSTYDAQHQLVTRTEQDAELSPSITRTTTYLYDEQGNLTRRTEPAPGIAVRHYDMAYDAENRLTYRKQPTGEESFTVYGVWDRPYQQKVYDAANLTTITRMTYAYDGEGRLTQQTDANGNFIVKGRAYDAYGQLTRATQALGHYTVNQYDATGRVTRTVFYDSLGNAQREARSAYDAAGRTTLQRQLAAPGGATSSADHLSAMAYDDAGRMTQSTMYLAGTTTAISTVVYDAAGRSLTQTQSDGPTTAMVYDAGGNVRHQGHRPGCRSPQHHKQLRLRRPGPRHAADQSGRHLHGGQLRRSGPGDPERAVQQRRRRLRRQRSALRQRPERGDQELPDQRSGERPKLHRRHRPGPGDALCRHRPAHRAAGCSRQPDGSRLRQPRPPCDYHRSDRQQVHRDLRRRESHAHAGAPGL